MSSQARQAHNDCAAWHTTMLVDIGLSVFFFFQAEDGIRDIGVTGVQTCALPISHGLSASDARGDDLMAVQINTYGGLKAGVLRSEERRVGKECRSRWSPYH